MWSPEPNAQTWGALLKNIIRPRYFCRNSSILHQSPIRTWFMTLFSNIKCYIYGGLYWQIRFLMTTWADIFINGLPDHRINTAVFKNAGALITFRLHLLEARKWKCDTFILLSQYLIYHVFQIIFQQLCRRKRKSVWQID